MRETYVIETLGPEDEGGKVVRRTLVRAGSLDTARERAMRALQKARIDGAGRDAVSAVRLLNGAGFEVFAAHARDLPARRR